MFTASSATASSSEATRLNGYHQQEASQSRHQRPAAYHRWRTRCRSQDRRVNVGVARWTQFTYQLRKGMYVILFLATSNTALSQVLIQSSTS